MSDQEHRVIAEGENGQDIAVHERRERSNTLFSVLGYLILAYVLVISVSYLGVYPFAKFSGIDPLAAASLLSSFVVFVICLALHSYLSKDSTRLASAISAGVMTIAYFAYLSSVAISRGLSVTLLLLFDILCGQSHCSISFDLGQLGIIALVYLMRDKLIGALGRAREP